MSVDLDWKAIGESLRNVPEPVRVIVHPAATETALGREVEQLARRLVEAAPDTARYERGFDGDVPATPALSLGTESRVPISFLCLPEGRETAPFVEAVSGIGRLARGTNADPVPSAWTERLRELAQPARLLLFVAPSCPHCPQAVSIANRLALASPLVSCTIVDVQRFDALAKRYNVQSVPRIILDGGLTLTEVVPAERLCELLLARGTAAYAVRVFDSLIESGRLADAALELRSVDGPRLLAHAWQQSTTSSRMGLLLAVEEVLEENAAALDEAVVRLLPLLEADDAALQGDTADLLGRIGHSCARDAVAKLLDHDNPDVVEIAEEALAAMDERQEA